MKILAIGNDAINMHIIKSRLLEFSDDWMIFNTNCDDAHSEINRSRYNLIIIDCEKPSESLIHKIGEIKQSIKNYNTPVLVCIQECSPAEIEEILEIGALDFIRKPFKSIELFARVRTALTLSSTIEKLDRQTHIINEGQHKMEEMLNGLIPTEIINEITQYGESKPKKYRDASVLFVDLVDFTQKSRRLSPKIVIDELSDIFTEFDKIVKRNNCTRIKTMGDGYLAVSGIPTPNQEHVYNMIKVASDMREYLMQRNLINNVKWDVKLGINSGEVIGSVLGNNNYLFDVFGDTVNEAARLESACEPNQINISRSTYLLARDKYSFIERLPQDIKGIGKRRMYYLKSTINPLDIKKSEHNKNRLGVLIEKLSAN
ncbi:adenylate/guanylate cyclase domain-containing response regulator [Marinilabiliaceae bacterium AAT]|uniref:Adenylate/guanylate cyclase domain-containing response regulator n=1 Tax=Plebeiibacterium sediminum TaxID=2992112 RepID=A0AAE3M7T5_9BACT|nr:adenylate/guanylate cyclase domain-containing response regulator [Plebeiobacterium sediminum]